MEIHIVAKTTIEAMTSGSDFFTCAKASWLFPFTVKGQARHTGSGTLVQHYVTVQAEGQTIHDDSIGGNNVPVRQVAPSFFPVATYGSECSAVVDSLSWADLNLEKGYEVAILSATKWFVSGVLNSTQTQANDPFGSQGEGQGFITGACWSGTYQSQMNPFV